MPNIRDHLDEIVEYLQEHLLIDILAGKDYQMEVYGAIFGGQDQPYIFINVGNDTKYMVTYLQLEDKYQMVIVQKGKNFSVNTKEEVLNFLRRNENDNLKNSLSLYIM